MQASYLVLDQGGHSSRALLFDHAGTLLASAATPVATQYWPDGRIEQQAQEILDSLQTVLQTIGEKYGSQHKTIKGAALIVQRSSLLAWRRSNAQALTPVLSWQDTRNENWLRARMAGQEQQLRAITGLRPNAHYGASKMRWLLDHDPAVKQAQKEHDLCIGPLAAFLQQHLTQSTTPSVDAVIASRTLLTALCQQQWSPELLQRFEIPADLLPEITNSHSDYGIITASTCHIPLRLLGGDQSFVALAQGETFFSDSLFINVGTGAFLQRSMPVSRIPASLLSAPLLINPGDTRLVAEGTVNAAATALDWLWQQRGKTLAPTEIETVLQNSLLQNQDEIPIFINTITATGSPDWLPAQAPAFSFAADLDSETVAVLESIIFALQRNIALMQAAQPAKQIVLSGGLSRSQGFCQRLADISQLPVLRCDDSEASARGAAYCLLHDKSHWQASPMQTFTTQHNPALRLRYETWSASMDALSTAAGR